MKKLTKLSYLLVATVVLLASNCKKEDPPPAPTASFTFSPTSPEEGEEVAFTATTTNTTSVTWSFGSPAIPNSTQNNPRVTYAAAGTYTVMLTARGPGGEVQAAARAPSPTNTPPSAATDCFPALLRPLVQAVSTQPLPPP